ncbi:MAG TPA: phosphoribosyltransferase [Kineosporiaceae bacterium]|nr:phosphoribosyltransferase [Kineosporiaceae bacterium]
MTTADWVKNRLGIELRTTDSRFGADLEHVVGLAVRHNPRRAHLLVSTLLGKHVPTDPRLVLAAGRLLGLLVAQTLTLTEAFTEPEIRDLARWLAAALDEDPAAAVHLLAATARPVTASGSAVGPVVLGYAETATALGHAVAEVLQAPYLHSTRRAIAGVAPMGGFEEEHSHATSHLLLAEDPELFAGPGPLVLVDDELSTGNTVLNTIEVLHAGQPRQRYLVATLIDLRSDADRQRTEQFATRIGARIDVVALVSGRATLPAGLTDSSALLVADLLAGTPMSPPQPMPLGKLSRLAMDWPVGVVEGGRHGFRPADEKDFAAAVSGCATVLAAAIEGRRVLVLGFEELMYAPLRIAVDLAGRLGTGATVRYSTTTRSPVLAVDDPTYPIRTKLSFRAFDEAVGEAVEPGPADVRYVYNAAAGIDPGRRFDDVVLIVDDPADTDALHAPDGLPAQLTAHCDRVHLIVLPAYRPPAAAASGPRSAALPEPLTGPAFGSYAPEEVSWLLTDLSQVALEAPIHEREELVQSGGHYAESLPEEYQPGTAYQNLFEAALERSAARVAHAVGLVTERILAARGADAVLVSLARAGTPVGILIRRWARYAHGLELPHYTTSIIRGRGIDTVALRYLAAHHDPASVMFVDGWTGKGAIARELAEALTTLSGRGPIARFRPDLAVLADPGGCVEIFGTRDDFLIPSACLNSTVSGLVSRTVLNRQWIGDNDFHGGKYYRELASADVSGRFLDAVTAAFGQVRDQVARDWPALRSADRAPTWAGWAAVEQISREFGIDDVNLVKPGVGETTRVLLRRVPWKILVRTDAAAELGHVRWLAERRGVEIVQLDQLPYSCVGLIHPRYTRGATGVDGKAARPRADTDLDPEGFDLGLDGQTNHSETSSGTQAIPRTVR